MPPVVEADLRGERQAWQDAVALGPHSVAACKTDEASPEGHMESGQMESVHMEFGDIEAGCMESGPMDAAPPDTGTDAAASPAAPDGTWSDTWALAIEGSGTGVWDRNAVTGEIRYSASWHALLGYQDAELSTRIEDSYTRVHPDDLAYVQATIRDHFERRTESYEVEHRLRCKDGSYKWVLSRGKVVARDTAGRALRMVGTTTDITAMRALSEELRQSVELITNLTNEIPGLVFQFRRAPDGTGRFPYVSNRLWDIYELAPGQIAETDAPVLDRIHPDDRARYRASLVASAAGLTPWHLEYRVVLPSQGARWRQAEAHPTRLADGSIVWHGLITDITERKRVETELHRLARIDDLTQLSNRRDFRERMQAELFRLHRDRRARSVIAMIDIDHFKDINDTFGHTTGDQVIEHFAHVLEGELRKNDCAGRLGGDEFAVVLSDAGQAEAQAFANRIRATIARTPAVVNGQVIGFTVSIGIAIMGYRDTDPDNPLARADAALYSAKENGRNRTEVRGEAV
jgi:diguanylate cyclase (GGDEF)-like protein/PAS domain S-box-containing protein